MKSETTGQFGGVGIEVEVRDGLLHHPSTPSRGRWRRPRRRLGDRRSDLKIDERLATRGINIDEAVGHMRGERGAKVVLTVGRKGWTEPSHRLARDVIKVENAPPASSSPASATSASSSSSRTTPPSQAAIERVEKESEGSSRPGARFLQQPRRPPAPGACVASEVHRLRPDRAPRARMAGSS